VTAFGEALKANPDDELSRTYTERCEQAARESPRGVGWRLGHDLEIVPRPQGAVDRSSNGRRGSGALLRLPTEAREAPLLDTSCVPCSGRLLGGGP